MQRGQTVAVTRATGQRNIGGEHRAVAGGHSLTSMSLAMYLTEETVRAGRTRPTGLENVWLRGD